jgi:hypothetical protein
MARLQVWNVLYRHGYQFVDDEAIIDLRTTIVKIEPLNADHFGAELECSLVCSRRFDEAFPCWPTYLPMLFGLCN